MKLDESNLHEAPGNPDEGVEPDRNPDDGQLMEQFIMGRSDAAFGELVRRHGPMVLGVCRRVTGNTHDAEDAYQAALLVLSKKAASVSPRSEVGSWLYGVAYRTSMEARSIAARRRARERQVDSMPNRTTDPSDNQDDVHAVLDQELSRMKPLYRSVIVLCELEGRSRREAAQVLKIPEGTLSSRLAMGKRILAERLTRRGISLSAVLPLASMLQRGDLSISMTAAPSVDAILISERVIRSMFMQKLKVVAGSTAGFTVTVIGGLYLTGLFAVAQSTPTVRQSTTLPSAAGVRTPAQVTVPAGASGGLLMAQNQPPATQPDPQASIQGTWRTVSLHTEGRAVELPDGVTMVFNSEGFRLTHPDGREMMRGKIEIKGDKNPRPIDLTNVVKENRRPVQGVMLGLLELDGNKMRMILDEDMTGTRPGAFQSTGGTHPNDWLLVLEKQPH